MQMPDMLPNRLNITPNNNINRDVCSAPTFHVKQVRVELVALCMLYVSTGSKMPSPLK